jgi:uncharacterized protein
MAMHPKKSPQASILNIASTNAYQPEPGLGVYAASKSFVLSFSKPLAYELRMKVISVTCVSPGSTDTGFVDRADMSAKTRNPARRFNMDPETVARLAVKAMFKRKTEVVTGAMNKFGRFLTYLLPKKFIEKKLAEIYDVD